MVLQFVCNVAFHTSKKSSWRTIVHEITWLLAIYTVKMGSTNRTFFSFLAPSVSVTVFSKYFQKYSKVDIAASAAWHFIGLTSMRLPHRFYKSVTS